MIVERTKRISANGRRISQVGISPVAFELMKRRTCRDFAHFAGYFPTSRTQERSGVDSNSRFRCKLEDDRDARGDFHGVGGPI